MGLSCGIVGLPNAGKSTIFNALTSSRAMVANYPFTTIDPNVGVVNVPDERLERLAEIIKPQRVIPTTLKFIDIAGLVKGASQGEGLGNKFLGHIREVDAIIHVVRCFKSDVPHVFNSVDPRRDVEVINLELLLADLETVEKRMAKVEKQAKSGNKEAQSEYLLLERLRDHMIKGKPVRLFKPGSEFEEKTIRSLNLLTEKPVLYVANLEEKNGNESCLGILEEIAKEEKTELVPIYGKLEAELAELDENEKVEFLKEMGLSESGLKRLVKSAYKLLDLITFYTTNGVELRAWSIKKGTKAPQAAGKIHSDFERGFIKAEVISYEDYIKHKSELKIRELGLLRIEGKDYQIQDGDMVYFRFKV
ncbi:MAG: ribosome-binding ATPase YchF [Deltaproteobacteria bacterium]|jgi:GTP-binding protein YchF|nr:MAG: ribosome-binding ATPase YchF [Deltaproteobacteria bacterium]